MAKWSVFGMLRFINMSYIKSFSELGKNDASIAGGKGASLGEMTQVGIPVPDGFVILASAFERFLEETDLGVEIDAILHTVNKSEMRSVEHASEKIQHLILNAKMPADLSTDVQKHFDQLGTECVAVRSSATAEDSASAAWAGQLESYLNTDANTFLENVQRCWASLFTPRAIFYRFEKDLHTTKISVAVVVQKMVHSELSGVAFSVHPITEDKNQLIIEAGYGLGEAIVAGQITPDSYVVEKEPRRVTDVNTNTQKKALYRATGGGNEWQDIVEPKASAQVLTSEQILQLAELVIRIEKHYGFPCDVEWAFENNTFYIVQSRPITTLDKVQGIQKYKKEDYLLVFWVQGVSVFVTDIHLDVYRELEVLYLIDEGTFKQYFTKDAYARALDRGLVFYSDKNAFDLYQKDLSAHCDTFKRFFEVQIKDKSTLTREEVSTFFAYSKKLCGDYGKMNIEYTDKAFTHRGENPTIEKNLANVAIFKDQIRAVMNMVLFESDGYLTKLFTTLGKQFNVSPAVLDNLTQREILALFESKRPDESTVLKRQTAFVESYDLDGVFEGKNAERVIQDFKDEATYTDTIKGTTANAGKIVGKVKIIPVDYSNLTRVNVEIEKMQQGEILVAETTAPELMVACKKAGAIVTDLGGLMSHAAIVSREFGIPCIVGTERASKVLKDGDLVEVDADLGIVKVLSAENPFGSINQWQRLFRVQGLRFLIDDIWMEHYQTLDALTVIINDEYTSYLPHKVTGKTLADGVNLISSAEQFERYETEFRVYMKELQSSATLLDFSAISKEETSHLLNEIARLFYYYSKTEFFSTDGAYQLFEKTKDKGLEKRLEQMGQIKNDGRSFLNSIFFGSDAVLPKLLIAFERRFGVLERNLQQYSREELLGLFDGKSVATDEIERRNDAFYIWSQDGKLIIKTGTDAKRDIQAFAGEATREHSETIAGTSAHTGQVRGPARIIRAGYDNFDVLHHLMDAMQNGDILVAETTSPELMPACQKAGGIITDQGGMLSHAAIVSRELNIPCVVGTSNATEAIKDGDIVEVDGDKGVVYIVTRF